MIVRRRTFRRYMYKARRMRGSFVGNYLAFLEGRLFMLVYRSNFVNNIFKLKFIIDRGIFLVDGNLKSQSNLSVRPGQLVQTSFDYRDLLKKDLKSFLKMDRDIIIEEYLKWYDWLEKEIGFPMVPCVLRLRYEIPLRFRTKDGPF